MELRNAVKLMTTKYGGTEQLSNINPLNTQLNPICHMLILLGAHPILHVSRIRVKMPVREFQHNFKNTQL